MRTLKVNLWLLLNAKKVLNYAYQVYNSAYTTELDVETYKRTKGRELFDSLPK